ncbi:hypothetical protein Q3G72_004563 [Acer saccharum]|nr:hypothetical protein Q3G72_004563 [Acer saccharum]
MHTDGIERSSSSSSSFSDVSPFFNSVKSKGECSLLNKILENPVFSRRGVKPIALDFSIGDCGIGLDSISPDTQPEGGLDGSEAYQVLVDSPTKESRD